MDISTLEQSADSAIAVNETNKNKLETTEGEVERCRTRVQQSSQAVADAENDYQRALALRSAHLAKNAANPQNAQNNQKYDEAVDKALQEIELCQKRLEQDVGELSSAMEKLNEARNELDKSTEEGKALVKELNSEAEKYAVIANEASVLNGTAFGEPSADFAELALNARDQIIEIKNRVLRSLGLPEISADSEGVSGVPRSSPMKAKRKRLGGIMGASGKETANAYSQRSANSPLRYIHLAAKTRHDRIQNLMKYISAHKYTKKDFPVYSKDPEWKELHRAAFPELYSYHAKESADFYAETLKFKSIPGPPTMEKALLNTNPGFQKDKGRQVNCQRCVPTYEMNRRGYDVTAKRVTKFMEEHSDYLSYHPYSIWKDPIVYNTEGNGKTEIETALRDWGNGARAQIVFLYSRGNDGHTFIAENVNGTIRYVDPQTNNRDCSYFFSNMRPGSVTFARIDNLEFSTIVQDAMEGRPNSNE